MADVTAELEAAITTAGTLSIWVEKYRHPDPIAVTSLQHRLLQLGDGARRLARAGTLDERAARDLLSGVTETAQAMRRLIDALRASPVYRRAVDAYGARDAATLLELLPQIFTDLRVTEPPAEAFWTPVWQRRGRPLPADAVVASLLELRASGVPATTDELLPGVDPELPGVLLSLTMPVGAPLAIRYDGCVLPASSLRLGDDQVLLATERLRLPFVVALSPADEPLDEWVADPEAYLAAVQAACERCGLTVWKLPTPAASS